jgi:hypothetical protein
MRAEAEFLDVVRKKVIRVFFLAIYSHSLKLVCNVKIVYGNHKSENSQDSQKTQRNCTFMNLDSGYIDST